MNYIMNKRLVLLYQFYKTKSIIIKETEKNEKSYESH